MKLAGCEAFGLCYCVSRSGGPPCPTFMFAGSRGSLFCSSSSCLPSLRQTTSFFPAPRGTAWHRLGSILLLLLELCRQERVQPGGLVHVKVDDALLLVRCSKKSCLCSAIGLKRSRSDGSRLACSRHRRSFEFMLEQCPEAHYQINCTVTSPLSRAVSPNYSPRCRSRIASHEKCAACS